MASSTAADCWFFLHSKCTKGSACEFRHSEAAKAAVAAGTATPCRFFQSGGCRNEDCSFLHTAKKPVRANSMSETPVCVYFQQNRCAKAELCPFSHVLPDATANTHTEIPDIPHVSRGMDVEESSVPYSFVKRPRTTSTDIPEKSNNSYAKQDGSVEKKLSIPIVSGTKRSAATAFESLAANPMEDGRPAIRLAKKQRPLLTAAADTEMTPPTQQQDTEDEEGIKARAKALLARKKATTANPKAAIEVKAPLTTAAAPDAPAAATKKEVLSAGDTAKAKPLQLKQEAKETQAPSSVSASGENKITATEKGKSAATQAVTAAITGAKAPVTSSKPAPAVTAPAPVSAPPSSATNNKIITPDMLSPEERKQRALAKAERLRAEKLATMTAAAAGNGSTDISQNAVEESTTLKKKTEGVSTMSKPAAASVTVTPAASQVSSSKAPLPVALAPTKADGVKPASIVTPAPAPQNVSKSASAAPIEESKPSTAAKPPAPKKSAATADAPSKPPTTAAAPSTATSVSSPGRISLPAPVAPLPKQTPFSSSPALGAASAPVAFKTSGNVVVPRNTNLKPAFSLDMDADVDALLDSIMADPTRSALPIASSTSNPMPIDDDFFEELEAEAARLAQGKSRSQ